MARMRSPDGRETVEVPEADVAHYRSLGATLVGTTQSRTQPFAHSAETEAPGPTYTGAPDVPLQGEDPIGTAINLGMAAGPAVGLARNAGASVARYAGPVLGGAGRAIGRRVLGKDIFDELLQGIAGAGKAEAGGAPVAEAAAQSLGEAGTGGRVVGRIEPAAAEPEGVLVREHVRGRPAAKKPPTGTARSRIKALEREAKIAKGAPGPKATGTAQSRIKVLKARGASSPELARRTAARARAVGHAPAMEAAGAMEAMLQRSLELEQEMSAMGIPEEMKALVRAHARAGLQP